MSNSYGKIIDYYSKTSGIETGRMFGAKGLKISGKVFAMEVKGQLVVKLPGARASELAKSGAAKLFDPGHGRLMKEWVEVASNSKLDWLELAKESFAYLESGKKRF